DRGQALALLDAAQKYGADTISKQKPPIAPKPSKANASRPTEHSTTVNGRTSTDWVAGLNDVWQRWSAEMWVEVSQLIRVRTVTTSDALLLSPTQAYFVRENVKLRLLNARLGLLSHNESAFRSDLIAAQDTITKYFDTRAKQTQTAQALLKQVQGNNLSINMPTLDSLAAIRTYKNKR
ncbi:uroporphyrinogen-III C-methyltransferase, partial [Glaciimonas sp. GG7]